MSLRTLVLVSGFFALLFSLAFLLAPGLIFGFLGLELNDSGETAARLSGAVGSLYVFLAVFGHNADRWTMRNIVGPTMLAGFVMQLLVALFIQMRGGFNSNGWFLVVLGLFFVAAYALLLRPERE